MFPAPRDTTKFQAPTAKLLSLPFRDLRGFRIIPAIITDKASVSAGSAAVNATVGVYVEKHRRIISYNTRGICVMMGKPGSHRELFR